MRRLAVLVLFTAFAAAPAFAQTPAVVDDAGLAAFKRCIELLPSDFPAAYDMACVHWLKGELDPAIEWPASRSSGATAR
jgi:hypothetical protein